MRGVLWFGAFWLPVGLVTGTLTLLGPVRWLTTSLRQAGRSQATENATVTAIIAAWVLASALLSWWLARRWRGSRRPVVRRGVPLGLALATAATLALWLNPRFVARHGEVRAARGEQFVFGPYPTEEDLRELKRQGYAGVVTLLHPAVVPMEPKLLADEREAAARAGISLIHLPMLPWISDNTAALDSARALARSGRGPFYVHCYLGKDRVNVLRRAVQGGSAGGAATARRLDAVRSWERGEVVRLDTGLYLTPMPTEEEYFGYVLAGGTRTVVSLLDPASAEDRAWMARERELLGRQGVPLVLLPVPADPFRPAAALEAARRLRTVPRPAVAHAFLSRSPAAEGVLGAFRTGLPPLPPSLFREPLRRGPAQVVAPGVAVGPVPDPDEYAGVLRRRGVAAVVWIGAGGGGEATGRRAAEAAGLRWERADAAGAALVERLRGPGPWYLAGPGAAAARPEIAAALGPPLGRPGGR